MRSVYLVGFMAVGKTTVGRCLAAQLGWPFWDTDEQIEAFAGQSCAALWAIQGESYFRQLERQVLESLPTTASVIACGGGVMAQQGMPDFLKKRGHVIGLEASVAALLERTAGDTSRPLLNTPDRQARIVELLALRAPFYAQSHWQVKTDNCTPEAIASRIIELVGLCNPGEPSNTVLASA